MDSVGSGGSPRTPRAPYRVATAPDSSERRQPAHYDILQLRNQQYDSLVHRLSALETLREQSQRTHEDEVRHLQGQLQAARSSVVEQEQLARQVLAERKQHILEIDSLRQALDERSDHISKLSEACEMMGEQLQQRAVDTESLKFEHSVQSQTRASNENKDSSFFIRDLQGVKEAGAATSKSTRKSLFPADFTPLDGWPLRPSSDPNQNPWGALPSATTTDPFTPGSAAFETHNPVIYDGPLSDQRTKAHHLVVQQLRTEMACIAAERDAIHQELLEFKRSAPPLASPLRNKRNSDSNSATPARDSHQILLSSPHTPAAGSSTRAVSQLQTLLDEKEKLLHATRDEYSRITQSLEAKYTTAEEKLHSLRKTYDTQALETAKLSTDNACLASQLSAIQQREIEYQQQLASSMEASRAQRDANESLAMKIAMLEQSLELMRTDNAVVTADHKRATMAATRAVAERDRRALAMQGEHEKLIASLEAAGYAAAARAREAENESRSLDALVERLRDDSAVLSKQLLECRGEGEVLQSNLRSLEVELASMKMAAQAQVGAFQELEGRFLQSKASSEKEKLSTQILLDENNITIADLKRQVGEQEQLVQTLQAEISDREAWAGKVLLQIESLEQSLRIRTTELLESQENLQKAMTDVDQHGKAKHELTCSLEAARSDLQAHQRSLAAARSENEWIGSQHKLEIQALHSRALSVADAHNEQSQTLLARIAAADTNIVAERENVEIAQQRTLQLAESLRHKEQDVVLLSAQLQEYREACSALKASLAKADDELAQARTQADHYAALVARAEAQMQQQREHSQANTAELQRLLDEKEALIEAVNAEHSVVVSALETSTSTSIQELQSKADAIQAAHTTALNESRVEAGALASKVELLHNQLEGACKSRDDTHAALAAASMELRTLSEASSYLKTKLDSSNQLAEERGTSIRKLQSQVECLEKQALEARSELERREAATTILQRTLVASQALLQKMSDEHAHVQLALSEAEAKILEQDSLLGSCLTELDRSKEQLRLAVHDHHQQGTILQQRLDRENAQRESRLADLEEQLSVARSETGAVKKSLSDLAAKNEDTTSCLERSREAETKLQDELRSLHALHTSSTLALERSVVERESVLMRAKRLEQEIEDTSREHDVTVAHWEQLLADREKRIESASKQAKDDAESLESRLAALQTELRVATSNLQDTISERDMLLRTLEDEGGRVASLAATLADVQRKLLEKDVELSVKNRSLLEAGVSGSVPDRPESSAGGNIFISSGSVLGQEMHLHADALPVDVAALRLERDLALGKAQSAESTVAATASDMTDLQQRVASLVAMVGVLRADNERLQGAKASSAESAQNGVFLAGPPSEDSKLALAETAYREVSAEFERTVGELEATNAYERERADNAVMCVADLERRLGNARCEYDEVCATLAALRRACDASAADCKALHERLSEKEQQLLQYASLRVI